MEDYLIKFQHLNEESLYGSQSTEKQKKLTWSSLVDMFCCVLEDKIQGRCKLIRDRVTSYIRKTKEQKKTLRSEDLAYNKCQWLLKYLGKPKDRNGGQSQSQTFVQSGLGSTNSGDDSLFFDSGSVRHGSFNGSDLNPPLPFHQDEFVNELEVNQRVSFENVMVSRPIVTSNDKSPAKCIEDPGDISSLFYEPEVEVPGSNPTEEAAAHSTQNDMNQRKLPETVDPQMQLLVDQICSGYGTMSDDAAGSNPIPEFITKPVDVQFPKKPKCSSKPVIRDPLQDSLLPRFEAQIAELERDEEAVEVAGTIWDHYSLLDDKVKSIAIAQILEILESFITKK
ncbi:hypothetical protein QAD02_021308 [Eretmocerus hayati]|uniref:Uncharacterized protein n=1 Tax=Eretmocerus hayati TaxID=131215 RepID=A0ACC2PUP9_9HYME|nr:hypothetical protein QAD02_021308 [Eretmocerus hayati]